MKPCLGIWKALKALKTPLKTPLCRLNFPYAACWDDLNQLYCVWCLWGHCRLQATAALSMDPARAQRLLTVASATANPRRIGQAAPVTPCSVSHSAPQRCFWVLLWQTLSQQQWLSQAAVIALTTLPLTFLTLRQIAMPLPPLADRCSVWQPGEWKDWQSTFQSSQLNFF